MCARNALDSLAVQHEADLQQARQQAVAEYCAAKALSEAVDTSEASVLTDLQASSAVSLLVFLCTVYPPLSTPPVITSAREVMFSSAFVCLLARLLVRYAQTPQPILTNLDE